MFQAPRRKLGIVRMCTSLALNKVNEQMSAFEQLNIRASRDKRTYGLLGAEVIRKWMLVSFKKWQRRRMIASLVALDDHTLWDIGIPRNKIEAAVDYVLDTSTTGLTPKRFQAAVHSQHSDYQGAHGALR